MAKFTVKEYMMNREVTHKNELTEEVIKNSERLIKTINAFFEEIGYTEPGIISSGWRPISINANTKGAAKASYHAKGLAIDIKDPNGDLGKLMRKHKRIRAKYKIWLENPDKTPGWCHCDLGDRPIRESWEFNP